MDVAGGAAGSGATPNMAGVFDCDVDVNTGIGFPGWIDDATAA
jgi:hypothetical protein